MKQNLHEIVDIKCQHFQTNFWLGQVYMQNWTCITHSLYLDLQYEPGVGYMISEIEKKGDWQKCIVRREQ